ncbi:hypothetical protein HT118_20435 [Escherichia coli]|nr:hypothetical protein [Escherichia coli]
MTDIIRDRLTIIPPDVDTPLIALKAGGQNGFLRGQQTLRQIMLSGREVTRKQRVNLPTDQYRA